MPEDAVTSFLNASMEAYFSRTYDAYDALISRAGVLNLSNSDDARTFYLELCSSLLSETPGGQSYLRRCRFLAWFATIIFPGSADALHEIGMMYLVKEHPGFARVAFWREWQVRKGIAGDQSSFVDVFVQLAVATDQTGRRKSAKRLLKHACKVSDAGTVPARPADMAYRLFAARSAIDGDIPSGAHYLLKAETLCPQVYSATPIQVHLAWIRAICLSLHGPLTLYQIAVLAFGRIAEDRPPRDSFTEMDAMQHMLARTPYQHLAVLSIGATLRLIEEGLAGDLTPTDVAITRNNFGNALLHANLNAGARQAFRKSVDEISANRQARETPELLYQLAHSCAGIGYSYFNEANAQERTTPSGPSRHWLTRAISAIKSRGDPASDSLRQADRWFSKALAALRDSHNDQWIDSRIWSCSARVCARTGKTAEMHRRFARALLAGHDHWHASSQQLAEFFNPDEDTRLKYMESLSECGSHAAAVILAKAAVHAVHRFSLPDVDQSQARQYVLSRSNIHRSLIENLSGSGRHNEAEQAYDLLKLDIHSEYAQRSLDMIDVEAMVGLTHAEEEGLRIAGISPLLDSVQDIHDAAGVDAAANQLASAFEKLDHTINQCAAERRHIETRDDERRLQELTDRLGPGAALVRYLVTESSLRITVIHDGRREMQQVPVKQREISTLVFNLRQQCRQPNIENYKEFLHLSNLLHQFLIAPIQSVIAGRDSLYIELDQPLAGTPFSALHNGKNFLAEEFSITFLNSAAEVTIDDSASSGKHVSVFLCSNLPGAELPGAGREGDAVAAGLSSAGAEFTSRIYADQECAANAFIEALAVPGQQRGAIHLATHANFNATSDLLSVLAFEDGAISVRRLRDRLETHPCQVGLFVLSACGTARQDVDVEGFSVTLLKAGVTSVLASLWESLDFSAPYFFQSFYSHCTDLGSPRAVAKAIQSAQLQCLTTQESVGGIPLWHPAHWATYVVNCGAGISACPPHASRNP